MEWFHESLSEHLWQRDVKGGCGATREFSFQSERGCGVPTRVQPDISHSELINPAIASVFVLPDSGQETLSYAEWQNLSPSNVGNLMAYPTGGDSSPNAGKVRLQKVDGHIELRFATIAGLTDVAVSVLGSENLSQWKDMTDQFSINFNWLEDNRVERIYRSVERAGDGQQYYRIYARPL